MAKPEIAVALSHQKQAARRWKKRAIARIQRTLGAKTQKMAAKMRKRKTEGTTRTEKTTRAAEMMAKTAGTVGGTKTKSAAVPVLAGGTMAKIETASQAEVERRTVTRKTNDMAQTVLLVPLQTRLRST